MHGSNQCQTDALAIKAYEFFMATHLEPGNAEARATLIAWVQESPEHGQAFLALDSTWQRCRTCCTAMGKGGRDGTEQRATAGIARRAGRTNPSGIARRALAPLGTT